MLSDSCKPAVGDYTIQHILQCKAHIPEGRSMAFADNLHVLWKLRSFPAQSTLHAQLKWADIYNKWLWCRARLRLPHVFPY